MIAATKRAMTDVLSKMFEIGVNPADALSDAIFTGNIGKQEENIKYLLSDESSIREKVAAISNTMWNAELEKPVTRTATVLFDYIINNRELPNIRPLYTMIQQITKNKYPESLPKKPTELWCPMLYAYPAYIFKRTHINLHSLIQDEKRKSLDLRMLIEPLSVREKVLLNNGLGMDVNNEFEIPVETGMSLYGKAICQLPNYTPAVEGKTCRVAGISGHSLLHFTLGQIFGVDWRYTFIGQLLEMVPIHHSMEEVCFAANDFGHPIPIYESYDAMRIGVDNILTAFSATFRVDGGTKQQMNVKPSSQRVQIGNLMRVVYLGPRGGEYIKMHGRYVPLAKAKLKHTIAWPPSTEP